MQFGENLDPSIRSIEVLRRDGGLTKYELGGKAAVSWDMEQGLTRIQGLGCDDTLTIITLMMDDGTYSAIRVPADAQVKVFSI